jgi:hypothetical protein
MFLNWECPAMPSLSGYLSGEVSWDWKAAL